MYKLTRQEVADVKAGAHEDQETAKAKESSAIGRRGQPDLASLEVQTELARQRRPCDQAMVLKCFARHGLFLLDYCRVVYDDKF